MSAHGVAGPRGDAARPARRDGHPASRPGHPADRPDLRVVPRRQPAPSRRRLRLVVVAGTAFVVLVVFGLVGMHVMLAQNQFRLDRLDTQAATEEARYERLRLEADQLESPQRIVATAEGKLGMVPPAGVIYLTPSGPVSLPGSTRPSQAPPPATTTPVPGTGVGAWAAVKPQLAANP